MVHTEKYNYVNYTNKLDLLRLYNDVHIQRNEIPKSICITRFVFYNTEFCVTNHVNILGISV